MKKLNELKGSLGLSILALGLMMSPTLGFAELLQGTITSLNEKARTINLEAVDPSTGQARKFKIVISEDVEFQGISSLKDLKTGDQVRVDASPGETPDVLEAEAIELVQK